MKAVLQPIYLKSGVNKEYKQQLIRMKELLFDVADFKEPVPINNVSSDTDAIAFLQLNGEVYRLFDEIKVVKKPIVVITSEFGTMAMWDWEIVSYMKERGVNIFAPYELDHTKSLCRSLALKRELQDIKFLVFQDNPGEGFQAEIFKRFYWWENECVENIKDRFGITIIKESFKELGQIAKNVSDIEAEKVWQSTNIPYDKELNKSQILSSLKIFIAIEKYIDKTKNVKGVGINCLNESHFSDTTPCLAFSLLYEKRNIIWGCEADIMSMLTEYIVNKAITKPVMMSNVYPFLMGKTALKHEKITSFPKKENPENYILVAHCGYFGLIPRINAYLWKLRPKVLEIVNNNAIAIDARYPIGDITFVKLNSKINKIIIAEGYLEEYVQFPGSDCRNGGVIKVKDGRKIMEKLYSHHVIFIPGKISTQLRILAEILNLKYEII